MSASAFATSRARAGSSAIASGGAWSAGGRTIRRSSSRTARTWSPCGRSRRRTAPWRLTGAPTSACTTWPSRSPSGPGSMPCTSASPSGRAWSWNSLRSSWVPARRCISWCASRAACGSNSTSTRGSKKPASSADMSGGNAVSSPKILVLGAGGIGGYFGGRLAESGADVTFLVRDQRRKLLAERGLRIESPFGDARVVVTTVTASEVEPIYDAIILTCKAYDLDAAVASIAPALAPTGYVLPLLNGIAHMEVLNRQFGENRVLGGTAKIQATLMPDGAIKQFNDWRTITFGGQSGEMTDRVTALAALYGAAKGVEVLAVT